MEVPETLRAELSRAAEAKYQHRRVALSRLADDSLLQNLLSLQMAKEGLDRAQGEFCSELGEDADLSGELHQLVLAYPRHVHGLALFCHAVRAQAPEESRATTGEGAQGAESCNVIAAASVEGEDGSGKRLDWLGVPVVTTLDWRTPIRAGLPQNAIPLELLSERFDRAKDLAWSIPASDSSCDRMRPGIIPGTMS